MNDTTEAPSSELPPMVRATDAVEPGLACFGGFHDGGDGVCVEAASCSASYVLGADGTCAVGWSAGPGMFTARAAPYVISKSGEALVVGGVDRDGQALGSTERFDPSRAAFEPGPNLERPRRDHTVTLLDDGSVLVAGGTDSAGGRIATLELYDAKQRRIGRVGALVDPRIGHTATALDKGRVLVAGGKVPNGADAAAEIVETKRNQSIPIAPMGMGRWGHVAAALKDGTVLVAGGIDAAGNPTATTELYDPGSDRWSPGPNMPEARAHSVAASLPDGRVLVVGGTVDRGQIPSTALLYNPGDGWTTLALPVAQAYDTLSPMPDGRWVVAGGGTTVLTFDGSMGFQALQALPDKRADMVAIALSDGRVYLAGGLDASHKTVGSTVMIDLDAKVAAQEPAAPSAAR